MEITNLSNKTSDFAAIDFETADYGHDSACSVAVVRVRKNKIIDKTHFLIRPPRSNFIFTYLHGITWEHVKKSKGSKGDRFILKELLT